MPIQSRPLTGAIGARVEGIRLDEPLTSDDWDELRRLFLERCVLVFPGQHLAPSALVEFAKRWGDPVVTALLDKIEGVPGCPEIVQIMNIPKETSATEAWHFDAPFTEVPPKISMLSAIKVPPGGDTMWSNQYLAFERLSPALQDWLVGLQVRFRATKLSKMLNADDCDVPEAVHPLVRTHPETGRRVLYVTHLENLLQVDGWTREESLPLLDHLFQQSITPDNTYRHTWSEGDLVMWDNRCTMHFAVHDYGDQERVLHRVTLGGEVPA